MTIAEMLLSHRHDRTIALLYKDKKYSYMQLFDSAKSVSNVITEMKMPRGNIAIVLPNIPEYIFAYFGILLSGNIVVPIFNSSTVNEIINTVNTFDISIVITDQTVKYQLAEKEFLFTHKLCILDVVTLESVILANGSLDCPITKAPSDVTILLGTSGSTSNPKRVMLTDKQIISNADAIIESLEFNNNEVFLVVSSFAFSSANTAQLIVSLILSAQMVLFDGTLHPSRIVNYIERYKITTISIVPQLVHLLTKYSFNPECTKTLKMLCCSGSIASPNDLIILKKKLPYSEISNNYGMTEAAPRISCQRNADKYRLSVGKPLKNTRIKILNGSGEEVSCGVIGQIAVKSPCIMLGYYGNPIETAKTIKYGWLMTGDAGYKDAHGNLIVNGRIKNVIITNGMNIYPEEIEDVLNSNVHVLESMVKGANSDIFGEIPIAFAVTDGKSTEWELIEYCRQFLQDFKVPRQIIFVSKLDKTGSGKIRRKKDYE